MWSGPPSQIVSEDINGLIRAGRELSRGRGFSVQCLFDPSLCNDFSILIPIGYNCFPSELDSEGLSLLLGCAGVSQTLVAMAQVHWVRPCHSWP